MGWKIGDLMARWRLVEQEPVKAKLSRDRKELIEINGLADVAVCKKRVALEDILLFFRGREDDDPDELRALIGAHFFEHLMSVHAREL